MSQKKRSRSFWLWKILGIHGSNTRGEPRYTGPCPPLEYEPQQHRYIFTIYALNTKLMLQEGATKEEVISAAEGHILAQAELVGIYKKHS